MGEGLEAVPAVRKAARLLKLLGHAPQPLGVSELSRISGTHKSTVSRILRSLELEGLVVQDPVTAKFTLGPEMAFLGAARAQRSGLAGMARPHLERIQAVTRETVTLALFDGEKVVAIDAIPSDLPVSHRGDPAQPGPVHCTAAGKVLLALQPERVLARWLETPFSRCTPRTLTRPDALRAELERVRDQGYAIEVNEWEEGLTALAVPVYGSGGRAVAALAVSGPTFRLNRRERRERVLAELRAQAGELSQRLGFRPPRPTAPVAPPEREGRSGGGPGARRAESPFPSQARPAQVRKEE